MQRSSLNFLASDNILANESVAKFWNSSTKRKKSFLWSAGISTLSNAVDCSLVIIIPPSKEAVSSPSLPCAKLTSSIFLLSIISLRSIVDLTWPIIFLVTAEDINLPTLFCIGETDSAKSLGFWAICAYSSSQNLTSMGSLTCFKINLR